MVKVSKYFLKKVLAALFENSKTKKMQQQINIV